MRRRSRSEILEPKGFLPQESEHKPNDAPLNFSFVTRAAARASRDAAALYRSANRRRWLIAFVHTVAGCCFAAAMTAAFLSAGKLAFSPSRFIFLTWVNAWPVLMAIDLTGDALDPRHPGDGFCTILSSWRVDQNKTMTAGIETTRELIRVIHDQVNHSSQLIRAVSIPEAHAAWMGRRRPRPVVAHQILVTPGFNRPDAQIIQGGSSFAPVFNSCWAWLGNSDQVVPS